MFRGNAYLISSLNFWICQLIDWVLVSILYRDGVALSTACVKFAVSERGATIILHVNVFLFLLFFFHCSCAGFTQLVQRFSLYIPEDFVHILFVHFVHLISRNSGVHLSTYLAKRFHWIWKSVKKSLPFLNWALKYWWLHILIGLSKGSW